MTHFNCRAVKVSCIFIFCHYLLMSRWVICAPVAILGHDSPSKALFEHSDFFQVNASSPMGHSAKNIEGHQRQETGSGNAHLTAYCPPTPKIQQLAFFNCNSFNLHYWSWNYLSCWHETIKEPENGVT